MIRRISQVAPPPGESEINTTSQRAAWQARYLDEEGRRLLDEDARYFLRQSVSTPCLAAIRRAEGCWIEDSAGQTWAMTFGPVSHTGWQQMTAYLDPAQPWPSGPIDGPDNGVIDYPIRFLALALDDGNDAFQGQGTIYIDDLAGQLITNSD